LKLVGDEFEDIIRRLTRPVGGQYPRPWMTTSREPDKARVFIVGLNQATMYPIWEVGSHETFMDALFSRNGQSCQALYNRIRPGDPSPTRKNIEHLTACLHAQGVYGILETNIICYSTPTSKALSSSRHRAGKLQGTEIFRTLLEKIRPPILIIHGKKTRTRLERVLGAELPPCGEASGTLVWERVPYAGAKSYLPVVFTIQSLSPPAYNRWCRWAPAYFQQIAIEVSRQLCAV
jgi:hypothetical protein